jgi:CheY-like chemotaxis protein
VFVSIRDTGIGIPPSMLPKIFEMFTQVGPSQGGLGIGLSLAKRLVDLHGGCIEARSEGAGLGSEFTVRLPTAAAPAHATRPSADEHDTPPVSGCKILIADDNPDIAESFEIMLQTLGYEVQTATNGAEALEKAEQFRPTAIVLDIGMPELDGYQAAKHIREQPWGKDVILIAVTGWGQESDRRKSKEAGFDAHLVKPIDATAIVACVEPVRQRGMGGRAVS